MMLHGQPSDSVTQERSSVTPLIVENRFDNCVSLDLIVKDISDDEFDITINVTFSHGVYEFPKVGLWRRNFSIDFGIKEGELQFELENMRSPPELRKSRLKFEDYTECDIMTEQTLCNKSQGEINTGSGINLSSIQPMLNIKIDRKRSDEITHEVKKQLRYKGIPVIVYKSGADCRPRWLFSSKDDDVMQANIIGTLAIMKANGYPCGFNARFVVLHGYIVVRDLEIDGFKPEAARKQKVAWARASKLIREHAREHMSKVVWKHEA